MVVRKVFAYKNNFIDFYKKQDARTQEKIEFVFDLLRHEINVPNKFYKSLANTNGIWEIRVIQTFKNIRILCFQDKGNVIILTNCFLKKTQKTPKKEIKLAEKLKKEYFNEKHGS